MVSYCRIQLYVLTTILATLSTFVEQSQSNENVNDPFHLSWTTNQAGNQTKYDIIFSLRAPIKNDPNLPLVSCVGYNACLLKNDQFLKPYNLERERPNKDNFVFTSIDKKPLSIDKNVAAATNESSECDSSTITIHNYCSTHWNPPTHKSNYNCNHVVEWHSPVSCPIHATNYEKPCYTFDTRGNLIDLTPWVLSNGSSYEIDIGAFNQTIQKFYLNVCNEAHRPCGPNVSSCYSGRNTHIESGYNNLTSIKYDSKDKTAILTSFGQYNEVCSDQRVKTVTRFVCKDKVFRNTRPKLIRTTVCENIIEWQTIHACPVTEYTAPAVNCSIHSEYQGINIDIKQIVNNLTSVEVKGILMNGKKKNFMLGLCQGINRSKLRCEGKSSALTAGCLYDADSTSPVKTKNDSEIIGSISKSFVRLAEGRVYLESFAPYKTCNIPMGRNFNATQQVGTRIEFFCSNKSDEAPKYLGYNECMYLFEWGSEQMCLESFNGKEYENNRNQSVYLSDKELKIDLNEQPKNAREKHQEILNDSEKIIKNSESHKSSSNNTGSPQTTTKDIIPKEPDVSHVVKPQSNSRMNKLHKFFMIALIVMSLAGFIVVILILDRKTQFRFPLGNMRRQARQAFQPQPVPYTRVDQFNDLDL